MWVWLVYVMCVTACSSCVVYVHACISFCWNAAWDDVDRNTSRVTFVRVKCRSVHIIHQSSTSQGNTHKGACVTCPWWNRLNRYIGVTIVNFLPVCVGEGLLPGMLGVEPDVFACVSLHMSCV
jgi:hypothetical protein